MDYPLTLLEFGISTAVVVSTVVFAIVKYVNTRTDEAKRQLRNEIQESRASVREEIDGVRREIKSVVHTQESTQEELKKISNSIIEIKTLLFGALGQAGILQKLHEREPPED